VYVCVCVLLFLFVLQAAGRCLRAAGVGTRRRRGGRRRGEQKSARDPVQRARTDTRIQIQGDKDGNVRLMVEYVVE
jgi:hypothetical protein